MNEPKSDTPSGSIPATAVITDRRTLEIERTGGTQEWVINEFNHGRSYLIVCTTAGTQFSAHFTGAQWGAFQALVSLVPE